MREWNSLTPIINTNGIFYKREDMFLPFSDIHVNGSRVRYYKSILETYAEDIKSLDNTVVFTSTVDNMDSLILARLCKEYGYTFRLFVGNVRAKNIKSYPILMNILKLGGKVNIDTKIAQFRYLNATVCRYRDIGEKFFYIHPDLYKELSNDILDNISRQVQNLPKDLDLLLLPCLDGIICSAILLGLVQYNITPKRVIILQVNYSNSLPVIYDLTYGVQEIKYEYRYLDNVSSRTHFIGSQTLDEKSEGQVLGYYKDVLESEYRGLRVGIWVTEDTSYFR